VGSQASTAEKSLVAWTAIVDALAFAYIHMRLWFFVNFGVSIVNPDIARLAMAL
jgi:hypothetical protein